MKNRRHIVLLVFLMLTTLACQTLGTSLSGEDWYLKLRKDALETKLEDLRLDIDLSSDTPYGIVMDTTFDDGTHESLISFSSGDSSLIYSTGNGRTDGIKYESVQKEAKQFVITSKRFVEYMEITTAFPLPAENKVIFYVLTPNGIYTSGEIDGDDLMRGNRFSTLDFSSAMVNSAFRLSSE